MEKQFIESRYLSKFMWYGITVYLVVLIMEGKPYKWIIAQRGDKSIEETWEFVELATAEIKYKDFIKKYIKE